MNHLRSILGLGLALSVALSLSAAQRAGSTFAVADIHGEYESFVALLTQAGLIDDDHEWAGSDVTFIQTGDYTDRGPEVRRVLDFLIGLERSAPEGQVHVLLGNHEFMNLVGDLRDTSPEDYEGFRDENSDRRRAESLAEYLAFEARRRERLGLAPVGDEAGEEWLLQHPPGFFERREALSATGQYGQWLRERPVVVEHENVLFMHAGIHPDLAALSVSEINERVHEELQTFDTYMMYLSDEEIILPFFTFQEVIVAVREELEAHEQGRIEADETQVRLLEGFLGLGNWLSIHPDGFLWYRGFAQWTDEEGAPLIEQLLDQYDVDHFVVGHTPQADGMIRSRFGGRLYLADTGMLASHYPGGQASMLEISDEGFEMIYLERAGASEEPDVDSVN